MERTSLETISVAQSDMRKAGKTTGKIFSPWTGFLRIVVFFLLIVVLAFCFQAIVDRGLRKIPVSKFGAINQFMTGRLNAQIVINGSSRALNHYDPRIIQEATGKSAFNIGMNASQIDFQLAVLKAYLKHNSRPEMVIQNLDSFSFETTRKGEIYDPGLFMPYLADRELYEGLRKIDPNVWKWKYIPLYGYAVEDMRFTWVWGILGNFGIHGNEDYFSGFNPRDMSWTGDFERFKAIKGQGTTYKIEPSGVACLTELIQLCKEQNIRLILVYSPEFSESQKFTLNRSEIFGNFKKLASQFGVSFWDFSDSPITHQRDLFYNSQHMNRVGAKAFSSDLAAKLAEK